MANELAKAKILVMERVPYIQKEKKQGLTYSFAGEAAILEKLHPAFREAGLAWAVTGCTLIAQEQYTTKNGSSMSRVIVQATYTLTHAESGQSETVQALGEGSDSGDKATSKAMTSALKYALRQTFLIETGDDPDHTPSEQQERSQPQKQQQPPKPQQAQPPAVKTPLELWERMGKGVPKTGAELYQWLEKIEGSLADLKTPSSRVFDGVMSFLKVGSDLDIKGVTAAKDIEGAWLNARNFVKLQADLSQKQTA
jgi:hypothetical protein